MNRNMILSIITPCSRVMNLPAIYKSILDIDSSDIEWIIIYDNVEIDTRILLYEKSVKIKLFSLGRKSGDNYASMLRNKGIEEASGKYLYFLDDDNLIHYKLLEQILLYGNGEEVLVFNQLTRNKTKKLNKFNIKNHFPGQVDTAQLVVPSKFKSRWRNDRDLIEEYDYIEDLRKEIGNSKFKFIDKACTYYNYLRRNEIK